MVDLRAATRTYLESHTDDEGVIDRVMHDMEPFLRSEGEGQVTGSRVTGWLRGKVNRFLEHVGLWVLVRPFPHSEKVEVGSVPEEVRLFALALLAHSRFSIWSMPDPDKGEKGVAMVWDSSLAGDEEFLAWLRRYGEWIVFLE